MGSGKVGRLNVPNPLTSSNQTGLPEEEVFKIILFGMIFFSSFGLGWVVRKLGQAEKKLKDFD